MNFLSTHFTESEFCHSQTADREGIDNSIPVELMSVARNTCARLEEVRMGPLRSNAVSISSGYRSEALERVICDSDYRAWCVRRGKAIDDDSWASYFANKQHPSCEAVDFTCPTFGNVEKVIRAILASDIEYDQLIMEHVRPDGTGGWVHMSFSFEGENRNMALIIDSKGQREFA